MNRVTKRALLLSIGLGFGLSAAVPAIAADKVTWTWSLYGPPRAATVTFEHLAKVAKEKSGGNFIINLRYNEQLGEAKDFLDGIKVDSFQGAFVAYSYAPAKTPLQGVLDMPFLPIPDLVTQARVLDAYQAWKPVSDELSKWNAMHFMTLLLPQYEFMGTGKPPRNLEDWKGMRVRALDLVGMPVPRDSSAFYFLCLLVLVGSVLVALNLLRSPTGRAFVAIRDSETAGKSMGIDLAAYKVKSFAISAAITGMAGVLFAHKMTFISPEMFTLLLSIEFIMVIIIGGAFGVHGAILGAIFMVMVDPFLTALKDDVPVLAASIASSFGMAEDAAKQLQEKFSKIGSAAGLKGAIYGLIIMMFILFEPYGLYGRWLKVKLFFQLFPLYKRATFKRQKTYVKSERNR